MFFSAFLPTLCLLCVLNPCCLSSLASRFGCMGKQQYYCLFSLAFPFFLSFFLLYSNVMFSLCLKCAAAMIPHSNTLGGIQLENCTSSVPLIEVILQANTHPLSIKQPLLKEKVQWVQYGGFPDVLFGHECIC